MAQPTASNTRPDDNLVAKGIREGLFAGVISLGMFILYIGILTYQDIHNALVYKFRFCLLATFVIIAAVGRFLIVTIAQPWFAARKANAKPKST